MTKGMNQAIGMENFTPIRNGILAHIQAGTLSPFDLGVYLFLHLRADWKTGIYKGCALTIAFGFGDSRLKEHIQRSLRRLRSRQYINYRRGDGGRSGYPILIHKYEPTKGELRGTRLNAWKHGELVKSEYEPKNSDATDVPQSCRGDERVTTPYQDLNKTLQNRKTNSRPRIVPHPLADAENHWRLGSELAKRTNPPKLNATSVAQALCSSNGWSGKTMLSALLDAIDFQAKRMPESDLEQVGQALVKAYFAHKSAKGAFAVGPQKFFEQGLYCAGTDRAEAKSNVLKDNPATRALAQMEAS